MEQTPNMTLGELIEKLSNMDQDIDLRCTLGVPALITSYRGYYEDLAIVIADEHTPTVGEFLQELRNAVGSTFHGYKGGAYVMREDTRLWLVLDHSTTSESTIADVVEQNTYATIIPGWCGW